MVGNLVQQALVLAFVSVHHGLTNGCHDFLLVEANDASVSFYYSLNHIIYMYSFKLKNYPNQNTDGDDDSPQAPLFQQRLAGPAQGSFQNRPAGFLL